MDQPRYSGGLQVNRVMCFSMDRPLQSRYQRMAEAFLDCRLPGEERTWLNDPFDDNLHRQSEGVRAQWNAALAALNTKPGLATSALAPAHCSDCAHYRCSVTAVFITIGVGLLSKAVCGLCYLFSPCVEPLLVVDCLP